MTPLAAIVSNHFWALWVLALIAILVLGGVHKQ